MGGALDRFTAAREAAMAKLAAMSPEEAEAFVAQAGQRFIVGMGSAPTPDERAAFFGEALTIDSNVAMVVVGSVVIGLTMMCDQHEKRVAELERKLADLTAAKGAT